MAMDAGEIERLIKAKFPDALVEIRDLAGDGDHYAAHVVSAAVQGQDARAAAPDDLRGVGRPHGRRAARAGADHRGADSLTGGVVTAQLTSRRQSTHCALERAGTRPADNELSKGPR